MKPEDPVIPIKVDITKPKNDKPKKKSKGSVLSGCKGYLVIPLLAVLLLLLLKPVLIIWCKTFAQEDRSGSSTFVVSFVTVQQRIPPFAALESKESNVSCSNAKLFIIVLSAPSNCAYRQAIRNTWGKDVRERSDVKMVFLVSKSSDSDVQAALSRENDRNNDMVLSDVIESTQNDSLHSVTLLQWINSSCQNVPFFAKAVDSAYINVGNLMRSVDAQQPRFLLGAVATPWPPVIGPWVDEVQGVMKGYPRHLAGSVYAFSAPVAADLLNVSLSYVPVPSLCPDVFITGMCASQVDADLVHDPCFHNEAKSNDPCLYTRMVAAHNLEPSQFYSIYDTIQTAVGCNTESFCQMIRRFYLDTC